MKQKEDLELVNVTTMIYGFFDTLCDMNNKWILNLFVFWQALNWINIPIYDRFYYLTTDTTYPNKRCISTPPLRQHNYMDITEDILEEEREEQEPLHEDKTDDTAVEKQFT